MYSVATLTFGQVARPAFMEPLSRFMLWVAVAVWIAVAAEFARPDPGRDRLQPPRRDRVRPGHRTQKHIGTPYSGRCTGAELRWRGGTGGYGFLAMPQ
jgi:hypothetical protein